jgi:hypothetical protein
MFPFAVNSAVVEITNSLRRDVKQRCSVAASCASQSLQNTNSRNSSWVPLTC